MKLRVTEDKRFLQITDGTEIEFKQLEISLTKKVNNWWIIKKKLEEKGKDPSGWRGEVRFLDRYHRIPIGLWVEIVNLGKKYHFPVTIENPEILTDKEFFPMDFDIWMEEFFRNAKTGKGEDFFPYEYQAEAVRRALKYRFCVEEISTSGGKTLISFMLFRYLLEQKKIKKMLYVVPSVDLVTQSYEEFLSYEQIAGISYENIPWKGELVFGGAPSSEKPKQITFGTYQSLNNKDLSFFKDYDIVLIDETHHAKANSIKTIITKCYNADLYRIGLTGTLPREETCDFYTIQAYLGPKVHVIHSFDLISAKKATPIEVIGIEMDYLDEESKKNLYETRNVPAELKDGAKLLNIEKEVARNNRERFNYIVQFIAKTQKNSLILFADIKNGYGRKIYDWVRANTEKKVYYIDGGIDTDNRDYYKQQMENEDDVIIVASVGTFSEGINIKNIHNIFITESHKSEFIIRQILGRGMRLKDNKDKVRVIDFSDNFEYGTNKWARKNYLIKHAEERTKIYQEKKFPYRKFKVNLKQK